MPYLNIDPNFPDHPKTRRLVGLVGGNAEGLLVRLWCFIAKFHGDTGRLAGYTSQEIEAVVRWDGPPGKLIEALGTLGWLHKTQDGYQVHDWTDHQGHIGVLKDRAKKGAKARWGKIDASSNAQAHNKQSSSPLPSSPLPSKGNPPYSPPVGDEHRNGQRRREKRRGEETIPHWQEMIQHMDEKWFQHKKAKFFWRAQYFKQLKTMCSLYQPYGVMALWDIYMASDDLYAKKAGYSFEMFAAKIPGLVDDPVWKMASATYERKLCGPLDVAITKVLEPMTKGVFSK